MLDFFKNNFEMIMKVLPVFMGVLIFIFNGIRIVIEFKYSMGMHYYFNVPYKYFMFDWKKSLVETFFYVLMVIGFFAIELLVILYRNEYTNVPLLFILFVLINFMYMFATIFLNSLLNNLAKKGKLIISILVSVFFAIFLIIKINTYVFVVMFIFYLLFLLICCINGITCYFGFQMEPKNKEYEVLTLNDQNYAIIAKNGTNYIVIKVTKDYSFDANNPFMNISEAELINQEIHCHVLIKINKPVINRNVNNTNKKV